jgi:thymidylate synthase (FAD)
MAGMTIEVQAPIFVFREWHRHRTQSYNELSARYTELPDLYYVPSLERLQAGGQDWVNKQSAGRGIHPRAARHLQRRIQAAYEEQRRVYETLLHDGLAREIARIVIPVGQYSRMRASANLRNWLHFATLRTGGGAQFEIREYATEVCKLIEQHFPRTYALWKT